MAFELDPRLAGDTVPLLELPLSSALLMDDARFPWIVLVPRREGAREIHELPWDDQLQLLREMGAAARALDAVAAPDKINVGALGNVVAQLHVHVVARFRGDAAWPGPVWGSGAARPYAPEARAALVARLAAALAAELPR
ncbi:HIT domain-containing protein [bacterium]|nr:HIT domain-containing protein [bacterium]